MPITGNFFIGTDKVSNDDTFFANNPTNGEALTPAFSSASQEDVDRACQLAWQDFDNYRNVSIEQRAAFLESIADEILALGDELLERAHLESGLPLARLTGERGRTMGQLQSFAKALREGDWRGIRVEPAMPEREPMPRPDLRHRKIPVGPVVVFGASNFPLAFSVAGGDTAAALAAGCPVVVKGHPAHPGTSELVGQAIVNAVKSCSIPEGVFSLLSGTSYELGSQLVAHPCIKAVGFTGSRSGGLALMKIANERPEPIPVYAEMSSVNPVVLFPNALAKSNQKLGQDFVGSLTMGAGQFCTNPGLILAVESPDLEGFIKAASESVNGAASSVMLTAGIHSAYQSGVEQLQEHSSVSAIASGNDGAQANVCQPTLFKVSGVDFLNDKKLMDEVFGATSLIVSCKDEAELISVLEGLEGQLTATMHLDADDSDFARRVLPILERKAGRVLVNGWPTGVEVSPAMVHGGPFPATSDGRTTSVGTLAIDRFLRSVCYQDLPSALLPEELRD